MRFTQMPYAIALPLCLAFAALTSGEENNNQSKNDGKPSPDGSVVLFARYEGVGDSEIYTALPDGSQRRKLTDNDKIDKLPEWSPNGERIVFTSNRSGEFQIHVMDSDGQNIRQVTTEKQGVYKAKYGPDGRIAYTALRDRKYKSRFYDLILTDGEASDTIVRRIEIEDFAWHPNGKSIVYGHPGQIVFHDLTNDASSIVRFSDIDKRLVSHGAFDIRWRPDKDSITCRIMFLGGRTVNSPKIFGDDEQFIITRAGKASWSTVDNR